MANATIWSNSLASQTIRQTSSSPLGEDNNTLQTNIQAGTNPNPLLAIAHLPPREGSNSLPATAHLPSEESSSSQATALLPSGEGSNSLLAIAHLPSGEGSSSSQATVLLPSREDSNSSQATVLLPTSKGCSNPQVTNSPRQVNLTMLLGQSGRAAGVPPGTGPPSHPRRTAPSPGKTTPLLPLVAPQGSSNEEPNPKWVINLSSKPLTPAHRSVLAKGPNFAVTPRQPPNL